MFMYLPITYVLEDELLIVGNLGREPNAHIVKYAKAMAESVQVFECIVRAEVLKLHE